ncbi:MAG: DUF4405 domain-containing protein [Anaerolineae bacterium]|nr:DUF4405 domain-containing protein [Anaerolineae bacterium]
MTSERRRRMQTKAYIRSIVAIALIIVWTASTLTGLILYVAPHGPHSGEATLLFLTKGQWGDVHLWVSVVAVVVTIFHLVIDWHALKSSIRRLVDVDRSLVFGK